MKRRGNRRYYQHHEVLMVRRIRVCSTTGLHHQGARNQLRAHAGEEATSGGWMPWRPRRLTPTCKPNCCWISCCAGAGHQQPL
jgi:DNA-binding transcriptional MerR regulator